MASSPTSRQPRPYPSGYPRWLNKALAMAVVFVMLGITVWRALGQLTNVLTILLGAWFLSLAMEPMVRWFVRHRVRRTRATGLTMLIFGLSVIAVLAVFGQLFVSQMTQFIKALPGYYDDLAELVDKRFNAELPDQGELFQRALDQWGQNVAGSVITITSSVLGALFTGSAVLLVAYYMTSAGPKFRAAVCKYMAPQRQHEVLHIWEVSQEKVSDFITSRLILAAISSVATFITLTILHVPYALPLAAFTGIVSQFVPTIGTYIGGALPVLLALTLSPGKALIVVIFIVAYQQVENYILSPRVSEKSMALNPAVAFVSVLAFGALFGALGAFLALPVTATIQAVSTTFIRRHALVESEMLNDGAPSTGRKAEAAAAAGTGMTGAGGSSETSEAAAAAADGD